MNIVLGDTVDEKVTPELSMGMVAVRGSSILQFELVK
jgi:small nuclear ribonucleoprotein (snRNP)-like protein